MFTRLRARWRNQQGFTLIELAVVVLIISVLITWALPHVRGAGEQAQKVTCEGTQRLLRGQLDTYSLVEKTYPSGTTDAERLQKLVDQKYLQQLPSCPSGGTYSLTIAPDGSNASVSCSKHGTLGL